MHPTPAPRQRPRVTTVAGLAIAALGSAVIPAAAGLAFLISLAARRPRPSAHRTLRALTEESGPDGGGADGV